jgi:hypothetical protein
MDTQLFACTTKNIQYQGNNFYFDFPYQNKQLKPTMKLKIIDASCLLSNAYTNTLILKIHERVNNLLTPDGDSRPMCALLSNNNVVGALNYNTLNNGYNMVVKTNTSRLMFSLWNSTDDTQVTQAHLTNVNILIECEYINEGEQKKEVLNLMNYPSL